MQLCESFTYVAESPYIEQSTSTYERAEVLKPGLFMQTMCWLN